MSAQVGVERNPDTAAPEEVLVGITAFVSHRRGRHTDKGWRSMFTLSYENAVELRDQLSDVIQDLDDGIT